MLSSLLVAFVYRQQLILGPALIIALVLALAVAIRFPSSKKAIGYVLIAIGLGAAVSAPSLGFLWGFFIGLSILLLGVLLSAFLITGEETRLRLKRLNTPRIRKTLYVFFAIVIVVCSLLISVRATGVVREEWLEKYTFDKSPNISLRGVVTSMVRNHEVNTGYSYHIFPAYVTLKVTEIVWGSGCWENQSSAYDYFSRQDLTVYYEKTEVPKIAVGQQVEVKGYYLLWFEDSLYSGKLVVAQGVNGSYLKLL